MASVLSPGEFLVREDVPGPSELVSTNGRYRLVLQADGNLVLYRKSDGKSLWASGTNGTAVRQAIMQSDGNFVIYGFNGALWASHTHGRSGCFLVVQDDGNIVIYQPSTPQWATNTIDT